MGWGVVYGELFLSTNVALDGIDTQQKGIAEMHIIGRPISSLTQSV